MATITRTIDSTAHRTPASQIALVNNRLDHVVTAVRTSEARLKLIEWRVSGNEIDRVAASPEAQLLGDISDVAVTRGPSGRLVTAARAGGRLNVSTFSSSLEHLGASGVLVAGESSRVTIGRLTDIPLGLDRYVTAVRDSDGDLKVIAWEVTNQGGEIARLADSAQLAGGVKRIALTGGARVNGTSVIWTAVRTSDDILRLIAFGLPVSDPDLVKRLVDSDNQAGEIDDVAAVLAAGSSRIVTASRNSDGRLRLIVWRVAADGTFVERLGDSGNQASDASLIALVESAPNRYLTAVRTNEGHMKLIAWEVSPNGLVVSRVGESKEVRDVSEVTLVKLRDHVFVTAVRDGDGRLLVIAWDVDD